MKATPKQAAQWQANVKRAAGATGKAKRKPKEAEPQDLFGEPVKGQDKPRSREESAMQILCVREFRKIWPEYARKLLSIPNGGKRDRITAAIMVAEGSLRGAWDLLLAVKRPPYSGMWIESKSRDGVLSKDQVLFQQAMEEEGFKCIVYREPEVFLSEIDEYLQTKRVHKWRKP